MDKRIAICIMAALMVLVVTAAYAPNPGSGTEKADEATVKETVVKETKADAAVAKTLQKVLDNQEKIMTELKILNENQDLIRKDIKFIRSKTH